MPGNRIIIGSMVSVHMHVQSAYKSCISNMLNTWKYFIAPLKMIFDFGTLVSFADAVIYTTHHWYGNCGISVAQTREFGEKRLEKKWRFITNPNNKWRVKLKFRHLIEIPLSRNSGRMKISFPWISMISFELKWVSKS